MKIVVETSAHEAVVDKMVANAFGPDRFAKTVYRLRDDVAPVASLSLVMLDGEEVVGTLRFWPILIGGLTPALLLGPLVASADRQGQGIGTSLMEEGLARAAAQGHRIVILVGDAPYYRRFGFTTALARSLKLPGWVDQKRFLAHELVVGAMAGASGIIGKTRDAPADRAVIAA